MPGRTERVLIVEDEPDLRKLYRTYLEDRYEVLTAGSGGEALEVVEDGVDAVLLDRLMPGMTGGETLATLRNRGHDLPVAMVTAVAPDFDVVDMGFDDYVVKPIGREELSDLVDSLLARPEYDDLVREYFATVSKVSTLQAEKSANELEASEAYASLRRRLDEIKPEARAALNDAIDAGEFDRFLTAIDGHDDPRTRP